MKLELQKLARRSIYSTCVTNSISIDIQWIPRSENEKADYISRLIDHQDWEVSKKKGFDEWPLGPFHYRSVC